MIRTFIALDLPNGIITEIKEIQNNLQKQNLFTGKFTEPKNLHLTLKFLGEISEEEVNKVKKKLSEIKFNEINANLSEIGVFSKDFIKIIWIKLNGEEVLKLQKTIDAKLKDLFKKEERFMSHVTIARVKRIKNKEKLLNYLKTIRPQKTNFKINDFRLKKSKLTPTGPTYKNI